MAIPPPSLSEAVERETAGTKVLWSDCPDAWGYARTYLKRAWVGIPFTAFAVFWTWGASGGFANHSSKSPPTFFILWGCMFILFGLGYLLSPAFAFWKASRIFYVVTERNAIIFEKVWSLKIHSFDVSGFGGFERISRGSEAGDILFQRKIEHRGKNTKVTEVGFLGLREFAEAERALRRMVELDSAKQMATSNRATI